VGSEIVILIVLAAAFIIMKVIQGDSERKRRIERSERLLRDKAATGGFSEKKKWDEFADQHGSYVESESERTVDSNSGTDLSCDSTFTGNPDENDEEQSPVDESK
tara:strand:+ start:73 stop:387 length:315 start_codon:yes stop_codon:yes gene_type:complete